VGDRVRSIRGLDHDIAERIKPPEIYLIANALESYLKEHGIEIVTLDYARRAADSLIKFFGPRAKVSDITPQLLKRYEYERTRRPKALTKKEGTVFVKDNRPVTKGTIRCELTVLAAALNHAVKYRRLTIAPPIYKPAPPTNRKRFLDKNEIQSLLSACSVPHIKLFVILAINTGSRKMALLDLK
jgi:integrase